MQTNMTPSNIRIRIFFVFTLLLNKKYVVCCLKQQSHPANKTLYNTINKQVKVCIYEILHLLLNIQIAGGVYLQLCSTRLLSNYIIRILEMAEYSYIYYNHNSIH